MTPLVMVLMGTFIGSFIMVWISLSENSKTACCERNRSQKGMHGRACRKAQARGTVKPLQGKTKPKAGNVYLHVLFFHIPLIVRN